MKIRCIEAAILISLVALFDGGCGRATGDSDHVSPEMTAILKERRSTNWEVSTAGLPQLSAQESLDRVHRLELAGAMEVYSVRPKSGSQDPFSYVVWRDLRTNQYWIVREGSLPGSTVVFGSGKLAKK